MLELWPFSTNKIGAWSLATTTLNLCRSQLPCHWKMLHMICKPSTPPRSPSERLKNIILGASKECSQKTEVSVESFPNGMLSFCSNSYAFFNKQETLKESNDRDLHHFTSTTSTSCSHFCCLKSSPVSTPSPKGHRANTGTKLRSMISCGLGSPGHSWNTVTYILSRSHSTNHPFKWRKLKGGCHKRCSYAFCD